MHTSPTDTQVTVEVPQPSINNDPHHDPGTGDDSSDDLAALERARAHFISSAKKHSLSPAIKTRSKRLKAKKGRGGPSSISSKLNE
jgi:hypothetical protein